MPQSMLPHRTGLLLAAALGTLGAVPAAAQLKSMTPTTRFAGVETAVTGGITGGLYPGAVLVIGTSDSILYAAGFGHLTWRQSSPAPSPDSTLWDIASLTKVVATMPAVMRLVDRGVIALDAPVSQYLPRFRGGAKDRVTVRMLLNHTSGLPSYRRFFAMADTREGAIDLLYREPLSRAPGASAVYSDLNAMLLGLLLEEVTRQPLDVVVRREVLAPLGMRQTMFRPPRAVYDRIAPTGIFRGEPVRGRVNDENAVRLGSVAGHAGLFATGSDLARYAQAWLREGRLGATRWVRAETMRRFLIPSPSSGTRLLGWDTRDTTLITRGRLSVFGTLLSTEAYGHTGWTGTELWIDPTRDLFLVFLTNRAFDPRAPNSIDRLRRIRSDLSDAVVRLVAPGCEPSAGVC